MGWRFEFWLDRIFIIFSTCDTAAPTGVGAVVFWRPKLMRLSVCLRISEYLAVRMVACLHNLLYILYHISFRRLLQMLSNAFLI